MSRQVGTSKRTLGKHALLDKILGREVGVLSRSSVSYFVVDLCAGDGNNAEGSFTCSPAIISKHIDWLQAKNKNAHVQVFLIEKDKNSFDSLQKKYKKYVCFNINSKELKKIPGYPRKNDFCFINVDPNTIHDWPLTKDLLVSVPKYTTTMITMGCNAGGIKRLDIKHRMEWFERIKELLLWVAPHHDIFLFVLNNDIAQWAYIVVGPQCWKDNYFKDARKAFDYLENGITAISFKDDEKSFVLKINELFLTKKEFENV